MLPSPNPHEVYTLSLCPYLWQPPTVVVVGPWLSFPSAHCAPVTRAASQTGPVLLVDGPSPPRPPMAADVTWKTVTGHGNPDRAPPPPRKADKLRSYRAEQ